MKIATICGAPNQNTGMMFVDRALHLLLKKQNLLEDTTFFCFENGAENKIGFSYKPLTKNVNLNDFDCIIIWGDFIVSNHFLTMTQPKIKSRSELFDYNLLDKVLMSGFTATELNKVIVFGQCIVVDDVNLFDDSNYSYNLKRLLEHSSLIKFRDPLSVYRANLLSEINRDFLGVDAALLNYCIDKVKINELKKEIGTRNSKQNVGLFFGRSKKMDFKKKILGFYLKHKFKNTSFKWLPWLGNKQGSKKYFSFAEDCNPITDIDFIHEILKCDLIITDTYHLSLMSWSIGVPCICYGNGAEYFKSTVHDKKKEIFFISNLVEEFYFYTENFYSDLKNKRLVTILNNPTKSKIAQKVADKISFLAEKNVNLIIETIETLKKTQ